MSVTRSRVGWYVTGNDVVTTGPARITGIFSRHNNGSTTILIQDDAGNTAYAIRAATGFNNRFFDVDLAFAHGFKVAAIDGELVFYEAIGKSR